MYQIREQVSHYRLVTMKNQPQSTKRKKHKLSVLIGELGKTYFTDELVAGRIWSRCKQETRTFVAEYIHVGTWDR